MSLFKVVKSVEYKNGIYGSPQKESNNYQKLFDTILNLKKYNPDFISVTYGASGSLSKNTVDIAEKCHLTLLGDKSPLPHYEVPEGHTNETYLEEVVYKGIKKRKRIFFASRGIFTPFNY